MVVLCPVIFGFISGIIISFFLYPSFRSWVVEKVCRPRWIVSDSDNEGELGVRICGVNCWYYKWPDPMFSNNRLWHYAEKREFGEVIKSTKNKGGVVL